MASSPVISPSEYLDYCQNATPRLDNFLANWDRLYRHHGAELCARRRAVYREFYGRDIGVQSSLSLCLSERYTACVNFAVRGNGVLLHICDILPIVIGSRLDREIRAAFWKECDAERCCGIECDRRKRGLIVQNKNYYHVTVTMATNPKVAHIYRKSNKASQVDSRVYYYDKNFRGNMFYFKKYMLLVPCSACVFAQGGAEQREEVEVLASSGLSAVGGAAVAGGCCLGSTRLVVVEELYLRNCFKQDYLLLRRLCNGRSRSSGAPSSSSLASSSPSSSSPSPSSSSPHPRVFELLVKFMRQCDYLSNNDLPITKCATIEQLLQHLGPCANVAERCKNLAIKSHDFSLENDLNAFLGTRFANASQQQLHMLKILVTLQNSRSSVVGLLCDCPLDQIRASFDRCLSISSSSSSSSSSLSSSPLPSPSSSFSPSNNTSDATPEDDDRCRTFVDNMQEFRKISQSCFCFETIAAGASSSATVAEQHSSSLRSSLASGEDKRDGSTRFSDQLYTLYTYMRSVIERNEDIDQLSNKCVFDGPYLYNKLLTQLREYLVSRASISDLRSVLVDTLISRYRQLSHTANLYMLISSKTNIRVELANDMKRSLKLSVKREKMQQSDYQSLNSLSNASSLFTSPSLTAVMASVFSVAPNVLSRPTDLATTTTVATGNSTDQPGQTLVEQRKRTAQRRESDGVNNRDERAESNAFGGEVLDDRDFDSSYVCADHDNNDNDTRHFDDESTPNEKCDFVVLVKSPRKRKAANNFACPPVTTRKTTTTTIRTRQQEASAPSSFGSGSSSKQTNLNTEFVEPNKLYLASCNKGDFIVRQLITYSGNYLLQNIAASHFTNLEFIFESVKRPNVANQHNSIKCSFMPRNAIRFLSYYNMGNLSSAGRTLNICYRNKVTFFLNYERIAGTFQNWLIRVTRKLAKDGTFRTNRDERHCLEHNVRMCQSCMRNVLINEVPLCDMVVDKCHEQDLFFLVKMCWPAAQFYRKSTNIISITLISGIIMIPVTLENEQRSRYPRIDQRRAVAPLLHDCWIRCAECDRHFPYFAGDRSSNVVYIPSEFADRFLALDDRCVADGSGCARYRFRDPTLLATEQEFDGGIELCSRHLWFSSNDLEFYETSVCGGKSFGPPFVYEIACHGLLLNSNFMHSTDISKLTVSINASRRRLRTQTTTDSTSGSRQLEMLVDQNSRLVVRSWSTKEEESSSASSPFSSSSPYEPLENIVQLPNSHNMFRCCFMFGDYRGMNVEDAYVFDKRSRPLFDNVVQLKMNFYRNDKLPITLDTLRIHFTPVLNIHPGGVLIFLCALVSNHKLSFGSTFVHVKITRIGECLWLYKFFYMNNSSYLRTDELIFRDAERGGCLFEREQRDGLSFEPCGAPELASIDDDEAATTVVASVSRRGDEYDDNVATTNVEQSRGGRNERNVSSTATTGRAVGSLNQNMIRVLFDETATTRNGNVSIRCQMTNKQLRFVVTFRRVTSVVKWQNNCGNKGVSSCVDLSDLYTSRGGRVHVIVSAYSTIGRQLVAQILEQHSNAGDAQTYRGNIMRVFSRKEHGRQVGYCGYGNFFFSCDSPHDTIIASSPSYGNNATRMCNMTYFAAIGNNLSTWIGNRSANHVSYKNNPVNAMPINIAKCLSVYHSYNRQLYMRSLRVREYRKKMRDHHELRERLIDSRLPTSILDALHERQANDDWADVDQLDEDDKDNDEQVDDDNDDDDDDDEQVDEDDDNNSDNDFPDAIE